MRGAASGCAPGPGGRVTVSDTCGPEVGPEQDFKFLYRVDAPNSERRVSPFPSRVRERGHYLPRSFTRVSRETTAPRSSWRCGPPATGHSRTSLLLSLLFGHGLPVPAHSLAIQASNFMLASYMPRRERGAPSRGALVSTAGADARSWPSDDADACAAAAASPASLGALSARRQCAGVGGSGPRR